MPRVEGQKGKILLLLRILERYSDEEHLISVPRILELLEAQGVPAERKSVYSDIQTLQELGYDIVQQRGRSGGYYLASRQFQLPELKLLADAVQASRFVTRKKSDQLIRTLAQFASDWQAADLKRQVFASSRIKTMNESIYYNVDKLHAAIAEDRQILFRYFEWTVSKEIRLKKGGENYQVSPWALTWDNENYYLIGYDVEAGILKHFRVDKMLHIGLLDIKREGREEFSRFDLARYTRQTFGMFGGNEQTLRLRFHNKYVGVVIDRFGKNVPLRPDGEEHFIARVSVAVSEQFFGWLTGLGRDAQILSPEAVVKEYAELLKDLLKMHEEK